MSNVPATESQQLPIPDQLNKIGEDQCIPRKDGESDADYAERLVYELDVEVENLWAIQEFHPRTHPIGE